jgi:hypothetical protein
MSWATQVITAYLAVFGALAAYATSVIVRGRKLCRELPPEERRWM